MLFWYFLYRFTVSSTAKGANIVGDSNSNVVPGPWPTCKDKTSAVKFGISLCVTKTHSNGVSKGVNSSSCKVNQSTTQHYFR